VSDANSAHSRPFAAAAERLSVSLGIINQQRALGWEPVLLTSGKHYAPGPARERIGGWEFLRTPIPTGFAARLPWLRELKIVCDLDRRLDDVIREVRPGDLGGIDRGRHRCRVTVRLMSKGG
jgi:hypothetical protein